MGLMASSLPSLWLGVPTPPLLRFLTLVMMMRTLEILGPPLGGWLLAPGAPGVLLRRRGLGLWRLWMLLGATCATRGGDGPLPLSLTRSLLWPFLWMTWNKLATLPSGLRSRRLFGLLAATLCPWCWSLPVTRVLLRARGLACRSCALFGRRTLRVFGKQLLWCNVRLPTRPVATQTLLMPALGLPLRWPVPPLPVGSTR